MCTHPLQPGCPRVRRVVGPIDQAAQLLLKSDDIRRQLRDPATCRSKCSRLCLRNARSHQSCSVAVHQSRGDEERMSTLVQTAATRCCICHAKPAQGACSDLSCCPPRPCVLLVGGSAAQPRHRVQARSVHGGAADADGAGAAAHELPLHAGLAARALQLRSKTIMPARSQQQ